MEHLIQNCTSCMHHVVEPDPDPTDWFNDDDVKVRCKLSSKSPNGVYCCEEPYITVACRPYKIEVECSTPNWCPLNKQIKNSIKQIQL